MSQSIATLVDLLGLVVANWEEMIRTITWPVGGQKPLSIWPNWKQSDGFWQGTKNFGTVSCCIYNVQLSKFMPTDHMIVELAPFFFFW